MIMRTDGQQGIILNVVVGIVGALLAGFVITPLIGGASIMDGAINIQTILISLLECGRPARDREPRSPRLRPLIRMRRV